MTEIQRHDLAPFAIGETLKFSIIWRSGGALVNVTGYGAKMQLRADNSLTSPVLLEASTQLGSISVDGLAGKFNIRVSTAGMMPGAGVWDFFAYEPTGDPKRLVKGSFVAELPVTR